MIESFLLDKNCESHVLLPASVQLLSSPIRKSCQGSYCHQNVVGKTKLTLNYVKLYADSNTYTDVKVSLWEKVLVRSVEAVESGIEVRPHGSPRQNSNILRKCAIQHRHVWQLYCLITCTGIILSSVIGKIMYNF